MPVQLPDAIFGIRIPSFEDRRVLYFAAGAASISIISLLTLSFPPARRKRSKPFTSPLKSALKQDPSSLPYPPRGYIPGARDIPSPYGNIRVYEFGPVDAERRVLFLHGISTPCVSLAGIASRLANKGCRVMLMDLFGRGYSDGPEPADVEYDGRLYASQILTAVTSSDLSWTGAARGFSVVGYSLGGGIAMDFASHFPHLVDDVVLIAPGGLQRLSHVSTRSKILYSTGILPEKLLRWLVWRRLKGDENTPVTQEAPNISHSRNTSTNTIPPPEPMPESTEPENADALVHKHNWYDAATIRIEDTVAWQLARHPGFVPAFMSSLRHAPIHKQHARWALVGARIDAQRRTNLTTENTLANRAPPVTIRSGAVLLILGGEDSIVPPSEVAPDTRAALGEENVEVFVVEGAGHDVAASHSREISEAIWSHWTSTPTLRLNTALSTDADAPSSPKTPKSVRFASQVAVGTSAPSPPPAAHTHATSPRVKILEQKLEEERMARMAEAGDAARELALLRMQMEEITGERDLLRAWVGRDVDEQGEKSVEIVEEPVPERACPVL